MHEKIDLDLETAETTSQNFFETVAADIFAGCVTRVAVSTLEKDVQQCVRETAMDLGKKRGLSSAEIAERLSAVSL